MKPTICSVCRTREAYKCEFTGPKRKTEQVVYLCEICKNPDTRFRDNDQRRLDQNAT